jgi:hypothetical protein
VSAVVDDLDILWDGYSHREIVEMVKDGPGAALTAEMERHLKRVAGLLNELAEDVNRVMQRTGEYWQGGAADAATSAMWVLRGIDDGMHFTSNLAGVRAFGQSDGAGWVRANMPPVVEVRPPMPTGGLIDILNASVDFQKQQAAAKEAEQRAREIMKRYTEVTRERAAAMTPLAPVPQVVLDITATPRPPIVEPPLRLRNPVDEPPEGGPVQGPDGGRGPAETGPRQPNPASPPVIPGPTQAAVAPGQAPVTAGTPSGPPPEHRGSVAAAPLSAGGPMQGGSGSRPLSASPGRGGGVPSGGRGPAGGLRGGSGRGAALVSGTASRTGGGSPFGVGSRTRCDEDREHTDRYGVPSAEHFEPDEGRDPHRAGWSVAPEVIGDEEGDRR